MTSEIRANIIKNRVGLGTIEYSNTGPIISGVTTALNFKTGTSNLHNTGLNVQDLDVDGHTNLDNVSVAGVSTFSGVLDATNTPASIRVAQDIQHKGDADTKLNFHADDKFRIELGGVSPAFSGLKSTSGAPHAKWGINVATPAAALHIDEAYNHQGVLRVTNGNQGTGYYHQLEMSGTQNIFTLWKHYDGSNYYNTHAHGSTGHIWYISGSEKLRLHSNGNVGIGTNNPQCILDINKDIAGGVNYVDIRNHHATGGAALRVKSQGSYGSPFYQGILGASDAGGTIRVGAVSNHPLVFIVNNQEKVRINTSGKVIIGNNGTTFGNAAVQAFIQHGNTAGESGFSSVDTTSVAAGVGGEIAFHGKYNTGAQDYAYFGHIRGTKENATAGDTACALKFFTRPNATAPIERLRIGSNGYVNIGTGTAQQQLTVQNSAQHSLVRVISSPSSVAGIDFGDTDDGDQGKVRYHNADSYMTFETAATERLRITSTGQLLLGETSAFDSNVAIQFRKDNAGSQSRFIFRNRGNNGSSRVRLVMSTLNRAANGDIYSGMEQYQSGGMAIFNGQSDTSHCNIGFFAGNWQPITLKNGNVSGGDAIHCRAYWGTSNGIQMEVGGPQSGTHKSIRFYTSHYGGERGYIGVTLGGTSYNSSSDYRMKQDVVDLTGAIDRVKSFKPRRFKWKEDPTYTVDGFLAHEASTVVPESVVGEKDAVDSNGDPEYQVMDNSKLVPVLTAALKEAIAKIEILEAKVAALEG